MSRHETIRARLSDLSTATNGAIALYYSYAPGDRYGIRWVLKANGSDRVMNTQQVEAFILGAYSALDLVNVR